MYGTMGSTRTTRSSIFQYLFENAGISFSLYFSICRVLHPCGAFIFSGLAKYVLAFCLVFTETNNFFF